MKNMMERRALDGAVLRPDAELWRRAVDGDHDAFGELFDRHARVLYNYCFRRTADWALAEDLMSTAFLMAWRRRADIRLAGSSVLPWLYGVATNLIRNQARSDRRGRAAIERVRQAEQIPDIADDVAGRLDDERRMRLILQVLDSMPEGDRDLFVLCVWQGLTYEEVAVALEVPVGTVRSRLSRARARLRRLEGVGHDEDIGRKETQP